MNIDFGKVFYEYKHFFKIESPVNIELYSDFPYLFTLVKTINITANVSLNNNFKCDYIDYTNRIIFRLELENKIEVNETGKANIYATGIPTPGNGEIKFIGKNFIN